MIPKTELDGPPVIEAPESEELTVAVKPDDLQEGDMDDPEQHPIAIAQHAKSLLNFAISKSQRAYLVPVLFFLNSGFTSPFSFSRSQR